MKKITLLALTMVGCEYSEPIVISETNGFRVVNIDSCEYIEQSTYQHTIYVHKGNCKFCAERRKKELDSLAIKIWNGFE